jgi:hypothetical protein
MRLKGLKVVIDGSVVKSDPVETGAPLLMSRYLWRARHRRMMVLDLVTYAAVLVVLLSVVAFVLYALHHPPGLYKEGMVHPKGFFIPYGELRDVEMLYPTIPLMPPKVSLVPYFEQSSEDYTEWYFHPHVLGDDGLEMLRAKVAKINEELGV